MRPEFFACPPPTHPPGLLTGGGGHMCRTLPYLINKFLFIILPTPLSPRHPSIKWLIVEDLPKRNICQDNDKNYTKIDFLNVKMIALLYI